MLSATRLIMLVICVSLFTSCSILQNSESDAMLKSENYNLETGRFHNSDGSENRKTPGQLFKMATAFFTRDKDPLEENGFNVLDPSAQPDSPTGRQVIWIGHSTLLVSNGSQHILTDPIFLGRASPFSFIGPKRAAPSGINRSEIAANRGGYYLA